MSTRDLAKRFPGNGTALLGALFYLFLCSWFAHAQSRTVLIGDSMTAEYDEVELPAPFDDWIGDLPTAYAGVSVPGWVSMSWVEVLGVLRPAFFNFGAYDPRATAHGVPRLSGYEYNYAIPGAESSDYREYVTKWYFIPWRLELDADIDVSARVVIWLGANNFRSRYGFLYDGGNPSNLIAGLIDDLEEIIDYVQDENPGADIVIGNIPDLSATPDKQAAHPNATRRQRVTAATELAGAAIADLAAEKGLVVADVYAQSQRLVLNQTAWFGAVRIVNAAHPDNNPRYHFTRDGLHPNTPSQIEIARVFIEAFNEFPGTNIPQITDAEALALLGIDPDEPFENYLAAHGIADFSSSADTDLDGLSQLLEYVFRLSPIFPDRSQLPLVFGNAPSPDAAFTFSVPPIAEEQLRYAEVTIEESHDALTWRVIPEERLALAPDGTLSARSPVGSQRVLMRLAVSPRIKE